MLSSLRTSPRKTLASLAFMLASCGMPSSSGEPDAYIENGVLWAYGTVQLALIDGPSSVVLKRGAAVESVDTGSGSATAAWALVGTTPDGDARDLAYADFHPSSERLLAYSYQLDVTRRNSYGDSWDVWAMLKKSGRSYFQRQKVYLGAATFGAGSDVAALDFSDGLKLSLIANGVFAGQWALHYPDVKHVVVKPFQGMCPKGDTQTPGQQRPGQTPGQNPGQFDTCRPLPPEKDLCGGDPTQAACRPLPPVQQPSPNSGGAGEQRPARTIGGLEPQGNEVFVMNADVQEAKIVFVAIALKVDGADANAALCASTFNAVARTVNGRVNPACVLTPAPVSPEGDQATCAVTIRFERAETYLERVCDVTAVFRDGSGAGDVQKVQVLKR
jgi:hypothetical protein